MSMKKFFIALLAMILCFSMLLTACGDKKKDEDDSKKESETDASEEKQLIIDKIAAFNLKEIVDTVLSGLESGNMGNIDEMINTVFETLNTTSAEANIDITFNGETGNLYAGLKDNVFQALVTSPYGETEGGYAIIKDGDAFAFTPYDGGSYEVDGVTDIMGYFTQVDIPDIKEQLNAYLTDDIMNVLGEFKLPELTKNDLTKDGDFYYINQEYYSKVAEDVLKLVVDVMKSAGMTEDIPSDAEIDATVGMIEGLLEALNLKIGFAAGNDTICGFAISVDADINALEEYFSGSAEENTPMPALAAPAAEQKVKVEFKALATKDLKAPKYVTFNLDMAVEDFQITAAAQLDIIVKNDELKGATMSLTASVNNVEIAGESEYNESTESWTCTEVYGDISINFTSTIDVSDLETIGSELFAYELSVTSTPKRYDVYDEMTGEPVSKSITLDDYAMNIGSNGSVVVRSKGSADVNMTVSALVEKETTNIDVSGNVNWLSAPNFKALPSEIANATNSDFADRYEAALRNADQKRSSVYNSSNLLGGYNRYLYYDHATGFYVILTGEYEGDTRLFINMPPQDCYDLNISMTY